MSSDYVYGFSREYTDEQSLLRRHHPLNKFGGLETDATDYTMDLISVLDIAASVASIVELSTGCIKSLLDLRASYQITDMNVQVSIAQLSTLRAALMQISAWEFESTDFIPSNLEMDFNLSLTSCKALIDGLNDQLVPLTIDQTPALNFRKKAQFLLNGREWSNLQTLLSHQISAIQLFLTTLQW